MPYERRGTAEFRCKLSALLLEHIANNNPRSFGDEQESPGRALTACSSTDEYDFPFETIHFGFSICHSRPAPTKAARSRLARMQSASAIIVALRG